MRFYVDARCFGTQEPAGVARYTSTLIEELLKAGHEITCISNRKIYLGSIGTSDLSIKEFCFFRWLPGTLFVMFFVPLFLPSGSIFLGANHCVPVWGKVKKVVFIHDFTYRLFPQSQTFWNRKFQAVAIRSSVRTADRIVFVSFYSREKFNELFPEHISAETFVLPNLPQKMSSDQCYFEHSKPFLFALGSLEPRKNLIALVSAFEEIRKNYNCSLILAGPSGWKNGHIYSAIREIKFFDDIHMVGYLTDNEISWHYENCDLFCFPSVYEGFGIPAFEALLCGAKVVATKNSEMQYFGGENNVWLFDPAEGDLQEKIQEALSKPKLPNTYSPPVIKIQEFLRFIT